VFLTFGWPSVFVSLYGLMLLANLLFLLAAIAKWYKEMAALAPSEVRA
jgi:hypothetical protein